jgi:hypothetical protein
MSYCSLCEESFEPIDYKYIYRLVNIRNNNANYFADTPEFAFDYDYLKVWVIRVNSNSEEYFTAVSNSQRIQNTNIRIS